MAEQSSSPFSDADIEKLLKEEADSSRESGWKIVSKSDLVEVWSKSEESQSVHLVKGFLYFPDIPVEAVVDLCTDLDRRRAWDFERFPHIELVEEFDGYKMVYWRCKMPPGITDRDILQYMWVKKNRKTDTTCVVLKDATHPKFPELEGFIRTKTILSGMIIRPDPNEPYSSKLTMLLQNDARGHLPKFAVNFATNRAPEKWRAALEKYYKEVYYEEMSRRGPVIPDNTIGTFDDN